MATAKASTSAQSPDKMKQLMNSDPKFIGRLINGLDANMGKMLLQKKARLDEIAADQAEIDRIDAMIKSHVTPNMVGELFRQGPGACMGKHGETQGDMVSDCCLACKHAESP